MVVEAPKLKSWSSRHPAAPGVPHEPTRANTDSDPALPKTRRIRYSLSSLAGALSAWIRSRAALPVAAVIAALAAMLLTGGATVVHFAGGKEAYEFTDGPFWATPEAWVGVFALSLLVLVVEHRAVRTVSLLCFGVAVIGLLGIAEPYGVFHDSWRNIGLGQLALSPQHAGAVLTDQYVAASPGGFIPLGLLRMAFPSTQVLLQAYPLLSMLVYCAGIYTLALAFADAHFPLYAAGPRNAPYRVRFGLMAVLAFLSIASVFSVRINPAPQSVAFAILPFFLAAVLRGDRGARHRLMALILFGALVLTHPITALTAVAVCAAFFVSNLAIRRGVRGSTQRLRRGSPHDTMHRNLLTANTLAVYGAIFTAWLVYMGIWIVKAGSGFVMRMAAALNSRQHAAVAASGVSLTWEFIWVHRLAMGSAALLIIFGLIVAWRANRAAGVRLLAWFAVSTAWAPLMLLGEFGDRGPLFMSLPAALSIAFVLNIRLMGRSTRGFSWRVKTGKLVIIATTLTLSVAGFATSYFNHVGEVISAAEIDGFHQLLQRVPGARISYGYVPPFTGDDTVIYSTDRIRAYALGAADFSYERLLRQNGVIAVSTGMRQAVALRSKRELTEYEQFLSELQDATQFNLVYSNDYMEAYRRAR